MTYQDQLVGQAFALKSHILHRVFLKALGVANRALQHLQSVLQLQNIQKYRDIKMNHIWIREERGLTIVDFGDNERYLFTYSKSWEDFLEGRICTSNFRLFRLELTSYQRRTLLMQQHLSLRSAPLDGLYVIETIHCSRRISYLRLAPMNLARPKVRVKVWPPLHLAEQLQLSYQLWPSGNRACTRLMVPRVRSKRLCLVPYVITHPIVWQVCFMTAKISTNELTWELSKLLIWPQLRCWAEKLSQLLGGDGVSHIDVRYQHPVRSFVCLTLLHAELGWKKDKLQCLKFTIYMFRKLTIEYYLNLSTI